MADVPSIPSKLSRVAMASIEHSVPVMATPPPLSPAERNFSLRRVDSLSQDGQLSFFQRHFTRPISKNDSEKVNKPGNRRFAFLARGSLVTIGVMLVVVLGIIVAVVSVTVGHPQHRLRIEAKTEPKTVPESKPTESPLRLAINENFPDPSVWLHNGTYFAYGTNNAAGINGMTAKALNSGFGQANVQLATSTDFVHWDMVPVEQQPLPSLGAWAQQGKARMFPPDLGDDSRQSVEEKIELPRGNVWAPSVIQRPTDNRFVLYYSANAVKLSRKQPTRRFHCVGAAISESDSPAGPFHTLDDSLACPVERGGAIDPYGYMDTDGTMYVAWKVDGNGIGHGGLCGNTREPIVSTPIMLQEMEADGITPVDEPVQILDRDASDGPLIEAPAITRSHEGIYFLFFSSGCTRSPTYDVKYATAKTIRGPYTRADEPILKTGTWGLVAPGSVGIHEDGSGGWNMALHARVQTPEGGVRAMFTTRLEFEGTTVRMVGENSTNT